MMTLKQDELGMVPEWEDDFMDWMQAVDDTTTATAKFIDAMEDHGGILGFRCNPTGNPASLTDKMTGAMLRAAKEHAEAMEEWDGL